MNPERTKNAINAYLDSLVPQHEGNITQLRADSVEIDGAVTHTITFVVHVPAPPCEDVPAFLRKQAE